jgi:hypothetical protein
MHDDVADDVDQLHVGDINWWMMWIVCMSRELHYMIYSGSSLYKYSRYD